jgi:hypothetical protein
MKEETRDPQRIEDNFYQTNRWSLMATTDCMTH